MNKNLFESFGVISSFENNFKPSASGCNKPKIPAQFGPIRSCKNAATLRSAQVEYMATTNAKPIITPTKANFSNASAINSSVILLILFTND